MSWEWIDSLERLVLRRVVIKLQMRVNSVILVLIRVVKKWERTKSKNI